MKAARALLFMQAGFVHAGWVSMRMMVGYRALEVTSDALQLGLVVAAFAATAILVALPIGRLADILGGAPMTLYGCVISAVVCSLATWANSIYQLVIAAAALGLGQLLFVVGQQAVIAERATGSKLDKDFGWLLSAISAGQVFGPVVVSAVGTWGAVTFEVTPSGPGLLSAATLYFIGGLLGIIIRPKSHIASRPTVSLGRTARQVMGTPGMWRAFVAGGVVIVGLDMLYAFLPAWGEANELSVVVVGWLLSLRAIVTVVSRLALGRLLRIVDRRQILVACFVIATVAFGLLPLVEVLGATLIMCGLGIALGLPQPITLAWVVSRAHSGHRGAALGLRATSNRTIQLLVPIIVGAAATPFGGGGIFLGMAVIMLGATFIAGSSRDLGLDPPGTAKEDDTSTL